MGAFMQLFARKKVRYAGIVVGLGILATLGTWLFFASENARIVSLRRTQDI